MSQALITNPSSRSSLIQPTPISHVLKLHSLLPTLEAATAMNYDCCEDSSDESEGNCSEYEDPEFNDTIATLRSELKEFLDSHRDMEVGSKTVGQLVSHIRDVASRKGVTFSLPSPEGLHARPKSIQLTGLDGRILSHREAMTQATLRGNFGSQVLIAAVQALNGREIPTSEAEKAALIQAINTEIEPIEDIDDGWQANNADLENLKTLLEDGYEDLGHGQGRLSISLASFPEFQEGVPVSDQAGTKRFLDTLARNPSYRDWRFNGLLSQAALVRRLSHTEEADLMTPAFLTEVNRYASLPGFQWNPTADSSKKLPRPSEALFEADPWVERFHILTWSMRHLSAETPSLHNDRVRSGQTIPTIPRSEYPGLLTETERLLVSEDRESVKRASAARACEALKLVKTPEDAAASEISVAGPTVADCYRQDPFEFAFENVTNNLLFTEDTKLQGMERLKNFEAVERYLPHEALPGFRERVKALASVTDKMNQSCR